MGFFDKFFGKSKSPPKKAGAGTNEPPPGKQMQTLVQNLVVEPFGKINYWNLANGGKRIRAYFLMESPIEGAQTGVAIDGSGSMMANFGKEALQQVREITNRDRQALQRMGITSEQQVLPALVKLGVFAVTPPGPNIVQEQARQMTQYLTKFDADGGTTVIYWAVGNDGRQIEVIGDLTGPQCPTVSFPGPQTFGNETHLLPAIKYFVERFSDARWGMYVFITDGALNDIDAVKRYCIKLARDIAKGKRNDLKFVLIGLGNQVNEEQMEELDDLETGTDLDLWDHKIAKDMKQLAEIFTEVVSETVIIVPNDGLVKDSNGNVVKDYRDKGLPALMWFDLPPDSQWFTLEISGQSVQQPLAASVQLPTAQPEPPAAAPQPKASPNTVACIECRRQIPAGSKVCSHCNTSQDEPVYKPPAQPSLSKKPATAQPSLSKKPAAPPQPSAPKPAPEPAAKPAQLGADPSSLDFGSVNRWKGNLPTLDVRLYNSGGSIWNGTVRSTLPWLEVNPTTVACSAGDEVVLAVSLTPAGGRLKGRVYNAPDAIIIEGTGQTLEVSAKIDTR